MAHFICIVQDGQAAHRETAALEAGLHDIYAEHFDAEPTTVTWRVVPSGQMFTEGRPSTSSIIAPQLARSTTLEQREGFMRAICDLWTATTGCTDHEIVVAITEIEQPAG